MDEEIFRSQGSTPHRSTDVRVRKRGPASCRLKCCRIFPTAHPNGPGFSPQLSTFNAAMNASCGMSTLANCRLFMPSFCFSRSFRLRVRLDCVGFDGFGKVPTDHTRCDDGVVPLICPTCQMVS